MTHTLTPFGTGGIKQRVSRFVGFDPPIADETYDQWTGLVASSRDSAGAETTYNYDKRGRLTSLTPPQPLAATTYAYSDAVVSGTTLTPATVTATTSGNTTVLMQKSYLYDALGRVERQRTAMTAGTAEVRSTFYPGSGWLASTSVPVDIGAPSNVNATTYTTYDSYGKPTKITAPDGTSTDFTRLGDHYLARTSKVRTATGDTQVTTVEVHDAFGRLVTVDEPLPPAGSSAAPLTSTHYEYDAADHLTKVTMTGTPATGGATTQTREFNYDGAGLLTSEKHPELGGNSTRYDTYDARGHAHHKVTGTAYGAYDLALKYDVAEHLIEIDHRTSSGDVPLKKSHYATANVSGDFRQGALDSAERYNYVQGPTPQGGTAPPPVAIRVREDYEYAAAGMPATGKTTTVLDASDTALQTFDQQTFAYDRLGNLASETYPTFTGPAAPPALEIINDYDHGLLTNVGTAARSYGALTYHLNGMVATVVHKSATGKTVGTDTQTVDSSGMSRPGKIQLDTTCSLALDPLLPLNAEADPGATVTLTVPLVTGYTYQWYERYAPGGETKISGATGNTYTTVALTANKTFSVEVTSDSCTVRTRPATVTVNGHCKDITVDDYAHDVTITSGASVTLAVSAHALTNSIVSYKWYRGRSGDRTSGILATSASFIVTPTATTQYWVEMSTSTSCTSFSPTVTITVCHPPVFTEQPLTQYGLYNGSPITLTTQADSHDDVTYQWYVNGTAVSGATDKVFSRTYNGVTAAGGDVVYCVISNASDASVPAGCQTTTTSDSVHFIVSACTRDENIDLRGRQYVFQGGAFRVDLHVGAGSNYTPVAGSNYEWRHGSGTGTPIPGGTSVANSATPTFILATRSDVVWCHVTHGTCEYDTDKMYLSVYGDCPLPTVTVAPESVHASGNRRITLTAKADRPNLGYQWYRGESGDTRTPIAGATAASLVLDPPVTGLYWCRVTDECGNTSADSAAIPVSVGSCPAINVISPPQPVSIASGDTALLSVDANSSGPFRVDWYVTGNPTPIASNVFTIHVSPAHSTSYYAVLTSTAAGCGASVTTLPATVAVTSCGAINVTTPPASTNVAPGGSATLSVAATAGAALSYQWYRGALGDTSSPIAGATAATVTVSPQQTTSYFVTITTSACSVDLPATVTVCTPPQFASDPIGGSIRQGQYYALAGKGDSTTGSYEWFLGTPASPGPRIATSPSFWVHPLGTTTYFEKITAKNGCGTASKSVKLIVCTDPVITTQPADVNVFSGTTATLTVVADMGPNNDTGSISYVWQDVGTTPSSVVQSGPSASFTTPAMTTQKTYAVRVLSGVCATDSRTVTVHVCSLPPVIGSTQTIAAALNDTVTIDPGTIGGTNTFTWYEGPVGDIANSTIRQGPSATRTLVVSATATKQYWAVVTNQTDGCTSRTAQFTVSVCKPTITSNPQSVTVQPSTPTTLSVSAGPAGVTYQWYAGASGDTSAPIANATAATLSVADDYDIVLGQSDGHMRIHGEQHNGDDHRLPDAFDHDHYANTEHCPGPAGDVERDDECQCAFVQLVRREFGRYVGASRVRGIRRGLADHHQDILGQDHRRLRHDRQ